MKEGIYAGIANELYHQDRTAVSSTWLKIIDSQTPYHLRSYLDAPPPDPSPALVMGSAVDCLIFEPEEWDNELIIAPEINRRTNVGKKEWADLQAKAKKTHRRIITNKAHGEALETAKAVRMNPRMADILKRGTAQQVFVWRDPITDLLCKCKADWYDEETGTVYDLKTARDASPFEFSKAVHNYSYHIQAAFYSDGIRTCGKPVNKFIFAVQEKPDDRHTFVAHPNLMAWYELEEEDMEAGRDSYSSALAAISFCTVNNEWAGYTHHTVPLTRPPWAKKTDMENVTTL